MRLRGLVLSVGAVASLVLVTAGAAAAQPAGAAVAQEQGTAHFTVATPGQPGTKQVTITCKSSTGVVYHSGTRILVDGVVSCTGVVSKMTLDVYLRKATNTGDRIVAASIGSWNDKVYVLGTASINCVSGEYFGTSSVDITFPPGFTPPTLTLDSRSPNNEAIIC